MKLDEIPIYRRTEYKVICPVCNIAQMILSQRDNFAEYHTEIYLQCQCDEYIEFILPVN